MLEATLGEEDFRKGVRNYMQKYAYNNTRTEQLWEELAAASGKPVAEMMRGFTAQGGVPMIKVDLPRCLDGKTSMALTQSRFGLDASSRKPLKWNVPVSLGLAGGPAEPMERVAVGGAKPTTATLAGCGVPIVNYGQKGYFRTLYSPIHFALLKEKFATIAVEDQIGLLADSLAMANGDYASVTQHLDLISAIPENASPFVWSLATRHLSSLDLLMEGRPERAAYRARATRLLSPLFQKVGWEAKTGKRPLSLSCANSCCPRSRSSETRLCWPRQSAISI